MTTSLMKQFAVKWISRNAGEYVSLGPCGEGDYNRDLVGTDFIMATSRKHAIAILRAAKGQHLQIKSCTNTDTLKDENT